MQIYPPSEQTIARLRDAIENAIDGAQVEVRGSGGHFEIRVVSQAFDGKNTLARQRLVYDAIGHLMKGDSAPVHAIDRMQTIVPG